jgi:hypothetical protein
MVSEKAAAFTEAAMTLATGGSAHEVVRHYRKQVRANGRVVQAYLGTIATNAH